MGRTLEAMLADIAVPDASGDRAREICEAVRSMRQDLNRRTRLPLARLWIISPRPLLPGWIEHVADECNVKAVTWINDDPRDKIVLDFRILGPRLGQRMRAVASAVSAGAFEECSGALHVLGETILEYSRECSAVRPGDRCLGDTYLTLDARMTPELEAEGEARDFVRAVQERRRELGLAMNARVRVRGTFSDAWRGYISAQVRAASLDHGDFFVEALA